MNRSIPIPGKLVPRDTVPPVCVEPAIREVGDFCQKIQDTFPNHIPRLLACQQCSIHISCSAHLTHHHVFHHKWKNQIAQDPGEYLQTLGECKACVLHIIASDNDRENICLSHLYLQSAFISIPFMLRTHHVHNPQDSKNRNSFLRDIIPVDSI